MFHLTAFALTALTVFALASAVPEKRHHRHDERNTLIVKRGYDGDVFHEECEVAESDRQQCGRATDEGECQKLGCCYQECSNCTSEVPRCFLAKRMTDSQCQVPREAKADCGYYGITEGECLKVRGCCWAPSPLDNDPPCFRQNNLRLVGGSESADTLSGRVEIQHDGRWGTVCDDNFDTNAANVVCRSLGYEEGVPYNYAYFGQGTGEIWLDGMACSGDEQTLEDCPHNGWQIHDCGHSEDAGVVCSRNVTSVVYSRRALRTSSARTSKRGDVRGHVSRRHDVIKSHSVSIEPKPKRKTSASKLDKTIAAKKLFDGKYHSVAIEPKPTGRESGAKTVAKVNQYNKKATTGGSQLLHHKAAELKSRNRLEKLSTRMSPTKKGGHKVMGNIKARDYKKGAKVHNDKKSITRSNLRKQ